MFIPFIDCANGSKNEKSTIKLLSILKARIYSNYLSHTIMDGRKRIYSHYSVIFYYTYLSSFIRHIFIHIKFYNNLRYITHLNQLIDLL